ncbi:metallophosphoesterase [Kordiimonas pumila]|uniref:Metallophosphoesterase n=1 Tax=Kordiimonas pumila TaxID=2161677 RepID=A0ABV7D515_9PROT|nr:metallophosphoesterase [Kordiimonas pumila]
MSFWRKIIGKKEKPSVPVRRVPEGVLVYAIGDVHGRVDLLQTLLKKIMADMAERKDFNSVKIIFLGDYVDRGFHSREVIDLLLKLDVRGVGFKFLAGNHEDMMLGFMDDPAENTAWLNVGGIATLASYGVLLPDNPDIEVLGKASSDLVKAMPDSHQRFLKGLLEHYELGDYVFVHAGLRPGLPFGAQRRSDKLGIRREFTETEFDFGRTVVHGHTGVSSPKIYNNRIAVDTGAFATGHLTAAILQNDTVNFIST